MIKLKLTESGEHYLRNIKACLNWLSVGGQIELKSGHKLQMIEDGRFGFHAIQQKDKEENEIVFQIDSDVAWQMFSDHAKNMKEEDFMSIAANTAFNEGP